METDANVENGSSSQDFGRRLTAKAAARLTEGDVTAPDGSVYTVVVRRSGFRISRRRGFLFNDDTLASGVRGSNHDSSFSGAVTSLIAEKLLQWLWHFTRHLGGSTVAVFGPTSPKPLLKERKRTRSAANSRATELHMMIERTGFENAA